MTRAEVAKLLAKAALVDARTVDRVIVEAWHELLVDIEYVDAIAALTRHRRTSTEYLIPAHIAMLAPKCRAERFAAERLAEARERAKHPALPEPELKPMPAEVRAFIENYGRIPGPDASFAAPGAPAGTTLDDHT